MIYTNRKAQPKNTQYTIKCPKCDGPDSAIRWKDTGTSTLVCLTCGTEWKQKENKLIKNPQQPGS